MRSTPPPDGTVAPLDCSLPGRARGLGFRGVRSQVFAARPVMALLYAPAVRKGLVLLTVLGGVLLLDLGCTALPTAAASPRGVIRGSLVSCSPEAPALTLQKKDGQVVATSVWHGTSSTSASERTLYFSFRTKPGNYYLAMNNDFQMPPRDRQIHLSARQIFTTHIVACIPPLRHGP